MWTLTLPGSGLATLTYKGTCGASANCIINGTPPLDAKWNAGACPTTYATWLDLADKPWGTDADRIETDVCDWYWFYRLAPRNTPRNFLICISPGGGTRSPHRLAPTAKVATTAIADCREHVRVSPLSPKGLIQPGAPRFPGWIGAKNTHGSMSAKGCSALADSITCRRRVPSLFSPAAGNTGECVHFDFDEIPAELNSRGTFHREASGGAGIGDQRLDHVNCVSRAVSYLYKKSSSRAPNGVLRTGIPWIKRTTAVTLVPRLVFPVQNTLSLRSHVLCACRTDAAERFLRADASSTPCPILSLTLVLAVPDWTPTYLPTWAVDRSVNGDGCMLGLH